MVARSVMVIGIVVTEDVDMMIEDLHQVIVVMAAITEGLPGMMIVDHLHDTMTVIAILQRAVLVHPLTMVDPLLIVVMVDHHLLVDMMLLEATMTEDLLLPMAIEVDSGNGMFWLWYYHGLVFGNGLNGVD